MKKSWKARIRTRFKRALVLYAQRVRWPCPEIRALALAAVAAAFGAGFWYGLEWRQPAPPPLCDFRGYLIPARIAAAAGMLRRIDPETEICVRYRGATECAPMLPGVEAAFRSAGYEQ